MQVPTRNIWQVLLMEYELLDAHWTHLHQRIWLSALVLIGLSMVGLTFLGTGLGLDVRTRIQVTLFVGTVAILLTIGWWFMIRRLLSSQKVVEYRKKEIEKELGMRMELYLAYAREGRGAHGRVGSRRFLQDEEEDTDLLRDLAAFTASPALEGTSLNLLGESQIWNFAPWLLVTAWIVLLGLQAL